MFDSQRAGGYIILGPTVPSRLRMINPTFVGLAAPSLASSSFSDTEIMRSSIHHSAKDGRKDKKSHEIWKDLSNFQDLSRVFEDLPPDFAVIIMGQGGGRFRMGGRRLFLFYHLDIRGVNYTSSYEIDLKLRK